MSDKNTCQEWHPDSDTKTIDGKTMIPAYHLISCCKFIVSFMSSLQFSRNRESVICSQLDQLLDKSVGTINLDFNTVVFGSDNKVYKNTLEKPKLASIIADEVKLYIDKELAGEAKEIAFKSIDSWLNKVTANQQDTSPSRAKSQQPSEFCQES